jgi:glucose/arabinose dehydrogenase/cytochrome c553
MRKVSSAHRAVIALSGILASAATAQSTQEDYSRLCAACHGASFRLPNGGVTNRTAAELAEIIRDGLPVRGMPAFGKQLSAARIQELARWVRTSSAAGNRKVGATIEAESLHPVHSANYVITPPFVGHFSERSSLCYDAVDLTGVRSIELYYAKGNSDAGRFAILIGDGVLEPRINLGEKRAVPTGSWETYARQRIGLNREVSGHHLLCFYAVEGGGILNLDNFALGAEPGEHEGATVKLDVPAKAVVAAAGYRFELEKVAEAGSELWSMAFLPDRSIIATLKTGQLLLFRNGGAGERIEGLPPVWSGGQGGLLAVKPHPQYATNGWIYLSLSDPGAGNATSMTRIVRGRLDGRRWVDQEDIFRAPDAFYTSSYAHFGSRIAFNGGYIYFSVGERQHPERAPDLAYPYGKIHRLHDDGRIPGDNPFVGRAGALPSIWSSGHRNPQGLTTHPRTGAIWSAEHGPMGGDELNLVRRGADYGWPRVSFGKHYDGTPVGPIGDSPYLEGVEPPVHQWTPSIGVSQIEFCFGDRFPDWNGQLLVASLGFQELRLVELREGRVMNDRLLFKGNGRIRDVVIGPDGYPYVVLNQFTGGIYRLRPVS